MSTLARSCSQAATWPLVCAYVRRWRQRLSAQAWMRQARLQPPTTATQPTSPPTRMRCIRANCTCAGAGGNDLLGGKEQLFDQKLSTQGNKALLVNYALGLPVRMLRRNDDTDSTTDTSLFYDGLYDVVGVWSSGAGRGLLLAPRFHLHTAGAARARPPPHGAWRPTTPTSTLSSRGPPCPRPPRCRALQVGVVRQRLPATDKQLAKGAETLRVRGVTYGPLVYVYGLRRRAGQPASLSKPVRTPPGACALPCGQRCAALLGSMQLLQPMRAALCDV